MHRPVPLQPEERTFRFDRWISRHLVIVEQSGVEWVCMCPMCGREKLAINVAVKAFHCFVCNFASWNPTRLVSAVLGVGIAEARSLVQQDAAGIETGPVYEQLKDRESPIRNDFDLPVASFPCHGPLTDLSVAYLHRREIDPVFAEGLGLRSVVSDGTETKANMVLQGRILFPVWNLARQPVFWAARATNSFTNAKVINFPRACRVIGHADNCTCYHEEWGLKPVPGAATAEEVVVGLNWLAAGETAYVVEGLTDVAVCGPRFCATQGAHLSVAQAVLIARSGVSDAILLYDGDEAGRRALSKAEGLLSQYVSTRAILCPEGLDPGEMGRAASIARALSAPPPGGLRVPHLTVVASSATPRKAINPIVNPLKDE